MVLIWEVNSLIGCIPEIRYVCVPERRTSKIRRMPNCSPMLATKGAPTDHDSQTCCLGPLLNYVSMCHCSWVVYFGNTRPRSRLLSLRLIQIKDPHSKSTFQRVTKKLFPKCFVQLALELIIGSPVSSFLFLLLLLLVIRVTLQIKLAPSNCGLKSFLSVLLG